MFICCKAESLSRYLTHRVKENTDSAGCQRVFDFFGREECERAVNRVNTGACGQLTNCIPWPIEVLEGGRVMLVSAWTVLGVGE